MARQPPGTPFLVSRAALPARIVTFASIQSAAEEEGLALTGWFHPSPTDKAPDGAETMLLFGYGGPEMWLVFQSSAEASDRAPHGLDRWSKRVITALAEQFGGDALFPFGGPPYQPFIRWTYAGEPIHQSKLGMSIHRERGLWSGWRGAIALAERLDLPDRFHSDQSGDPPCDPCPAPCRSACPVNAFTEAGYDAAACRAHLDSPEGAPCRAAGCLARRACPVGQDYAQSAEQAAFHLEAFRVA